jgi:hypothetical protein
VGPVSAAKGRTLPMLGHYPLQMVVILRFLERSPVEDNMVAGAARTPSTTNL